MRRPNQLNHHTLTKSQSAESKTRLVAFPPKSIFEAELDHLPMKDLPVSV